MEREEATWLESWAEVDRATAVAQQTRRYLSSPPGVGLAVGLAKHLSAFNATDDLIPYFGDYRLAHTEAFFQLRNSVCLGYHGFYGQAFTALRSVCELSLLQALLPPGDTATDRALDLLRSMLPPGEVLPGRDEVNFVFPAGFAATQSPEREAESLAGWAVDGCRVPSWRRMLGQLREHEVFREFDTQRRISDRLEKLHSALDPYVHVRGRLRSATGLSGGNTLRFPEKALSEFGDQMASVTQASVTVLLVAFLPRANSNPEAAAGFVHRADLERALGVLPPDEAQLLRGIYDDRNT